MTSYTTSIDIWGILLFYYSKNKKNEAVGCILAELITLEPIFQGKTEGDQLFSIFKVLGSPANEDFAIWEKILVNFDHVLFAEFKNFKPMDLKKSFPGFKDVDNLLDLLGKMFDYIPTRRISASEALKHPFFAKE